MQKNISLEEAQNLIFDYCPLAEKENSHLADTLVRVLAEDIVARENIPPFPRSPYDGFVFKAEDTVGASEANPVTFEVIEEVPAGYTAQNAVSKGQAIKILTGAPIPEGADAVVKFEEVEVQGSKISVSKAFKHGEDIVPEGEDIAVGDLIAAEGTVVTAPLMGLMASLGIAEVPVYKRPKIAIISTGDELRDVTEPLAPGKIRNSNSYTLQGYLRLLGVEPVVMGICKDKKEEVAALVEKAWKQADLVLTTGGVSVGDYDVIRHAADYLGAEILFWKIEIKPGSPCLAAVKDGKMLIGLSGNPAAAMVTFQLMAVPYIKKMAGRKDYYYRKIEVILKKDFRKPSPRRRFLRGRMLYENGMVIMESTGEQGNGVLRSMLGCDILAEIPEKSGPVKAGEKLIAYIIE
ncbi:MULTISPECIES: gephyrin-like molybdotransferase Glp [unclassified Dehalobacter]|uniref:molybdopterin molybdotransferase MoeA n=1 Tax=unclassified Dehalobacter TaxID=2635733 RepID=UPI0003667BE4|nr:MULTISPECIES: gephyrin-like molybdotransferase Glp [unclassified Dehalobacter]RJE48857.1 molybdopterin molybdenumtransferase MoeA [Dehalobacter sp. MCB1]TCX52019.1 molybdopterin molybdenumtransferase MoeA [Dehalobacter sp. 14DCB1]TCX53093.1 molybdopterin molybdenumtransferase MoeA [Dehalobacter sp. 12DCB1]